MTWPTQPEVPYPADDTETRAPQAPPAAGRSKPGAPRVLRLRIAPWDVVSTVVLLALLIVLATATPWPAKLFGFLEHVCEGDTCGPVPFGIDYYIRPLVWGGVGAAIAAAVVGPLISLLKGWYMSFWPVLSLAILLVSSVAGSILTTFSQRYWL